MSLFTEISPDKLWRRIARPDAPALVDVRTEEDFAADPRLVPGASHRPALAVADWGAAFRGGQMVAIALRHLARIVRGTDTARPGLEPEAAGLLAVSPGLSRVHADALAQLEASLPLYDALRRWCRDATGETHNWPAPQ
jgi:hypothetical protein